MSVPIWEFIVDVPSPGRDHRKNKPSTLLQQNVIDVRIVGTDPVRHVRDVELDGSTTTRFEVDEEQAVHGVEEVARMRFACSSCWAGPRPRIC